MHGAESIREERASLEHDHSAAPYVVVWLALLALTVITYVTARFVDLGAWNILLAMVIASVKASMVIWVFMHLNVAAGMNRLAIGISILFVGVLILLTLADVWSRFDASLPPRGDPVTAEGAVHGDASSEAAGGHSTPPRSH